MERNNEIEFDVAERYLCELSKGSIYRMKTVKGKGRGEIQVNKRTGKQNNHMWK